MGILKLRWLLYVCILNISAMEMDDDELIRQLIKQADEARAHGFTQSEAHISVPAVQSLLRKDKNLDLNKNKKIIQRVLERERQYKDYYVFYTSVPRMHLLQDVTRKTI